MPRTRLAGIATALAALLIGIPAGAAPILLRDINPVAKERLLGSQSVIFGNRLFTSFFTPETGAELTVIDLSTGSLDIIDVEPGPTSAFRFGTTFIPLSSRVLFTATTDEHGEELWATNGTPQTTVLVGDIRPGNLGSRPQHLSKVDHDTVLFQADDGTSGRELWITNGEEALLFADIAPGEESSDPHAIISTGNGFLMTACDYDGVYCEPFFLRPFVTSGFLDVVSPGGSAPREYATLANPAQAVFSGNTSTTDANDYELWITDVATLPGTTLVKNFISGGVGGDPRNFQLVNGVVVFDTDTAQNGRELHRTDGTSGGTTMIADVFPGSRSGLTGSTRALLGTSSLVFHGVFEDAGTELAVTDGFSVTRLADTIPGPRSGVLDARIVTTTTKAYAALADTTNGLELWETDGTPEGTALVADLLPGPPSSQPRLVATDDDTVYFLAHGPGSYGLWRRSDGAPSLVRDLSTGSTDDASIGRPARAGDRLLFAAFEPEAGDELWTTDGTPEGTERLVDLIPGFQSGVPSGLTTVGERVLFSADDGLSGRELHVSDGTPAGTHLLVDIFPGSRGSNPGPQAVLGGRLLFTATTEAEGNELWVSDGTPEGTQLLKDVQPGEANGNPSNIVTSGDRAFFVAGTLWITDGTPDGTTPVDTDARLAGFPVPFGEGSVLFAGFPSFTFFDDRELWISDGGTTGTRLVKELVAGTSDGGNPRSITVAGSRAFFIATTNEGVGLWVTDGTEPGTTLVKAPIAPSEDEVSGFEMVAIGERVAFTVVANNGRSLWVSDGTPAGTQQVSGLCPPGQTCGPNQLFAYENFAFFNFDDGTHGMELWQTDGTPAGTSMVAELVPGTAPITFSRFTVGVLAGKLFFSACEGTHGCEPWIFDFDQCPTDTGKLAPGACGCTVADVDTDGSGVVDCLIGSELRARLDALRALIESVTKPKSKDERRAFKEKVAAILAAFDAVVAYRDARSNDFPDLVNPLKKVKKAIKRLRKKRGATSARNKALAAVATARDAVVGP